MVNVLAAVADMIVDGKESERLGTRTLACEVVVYFVQSERSYEPSNNRHGALVVVLGVRELRAICVGWRIKYEESNMRNRRKGVDRTRGPRR